MTLYKPSSNVQATFNTASIEVEALSEYHAKKIAAGLIGYGIDRITNVHLIKQPRNAKTCTTNDYPTRGTRKWKTVYQVHTYGQSVLVGRDKHEHTHMEIVRDDIETKTEAVKIAREMAIKHQMPMMVQIVQKSESHDSTCAEIVPKTTPGKFKVYYLV